MPNYQNGRIYTVRCPTDNSLIYVGSTRIPLSKRLSLHKSDTGCSLYRLIHNNFNSDLSNFYIESYEEYPCNNKEFLNKREGEIEREIATTNKSKAGRSVKQCYMANRSDILHNRKEYHTNSRDEKYIII